jgi:glycerol-3-phosphate dehydrogenase
VVNAGGPWSDRVRRLADPSAERRIRMTKGAHVLVRRDRVGNRNAVIFRSPVDGRVMFVLPWGAFTYIGTTDTEFDGDPADAVADLDDIRYLLDSAIFPAAALTESDLVSTWAGVRPLLAPRRSGQVSASATSREHAIWRDPSGLLNVAGGKLTTFRSMSAEVARTAADILRDEYGVRSGEFHSQYVSLPGAPDLGMERLIASLDAEARALGLADGSVRGIARRHGTDATLILRIIEADRSLAALLHPDLDCVLAEVVHAVRTEMAMTLEDVMRRRLHPFYELPDGGVAIAGDVARLLARELGWSDEEISRQRRLYSESVARTRPERAEP